MLQTQKVRLVCAILIAGMVIALVYHGFVGLVLHRGYPSDTFLFRPWLRFSDFSDSIAPVREGSPYANRLSIYFPFSYLILYPLALIRVRYALALLLLLFSGCTFAFFWRSVTSLGGKWRVAAAAVLTFGTYPFLFCIDRANLEMLVLLLTFWFVAAVARGKFLTASVPLACAIAMKLYPGVLGVLLLQRRQYKAAALTAILTVVLTVGAAAAFPGGVSPTFHLLANNYHRFGDEYVLSPKTVPFSSNYFALVKLVTALLGGNVIATARAALTPYGIASLLLFSGVCLFIMSRELALWKQAVLLLAMAILLPQVSFDYRMIHLLVPLGLFIVAPPGRTRDDRVHAALFGLLLIPKAYGPLGSETTVGVILNPLLLTALMGHIIWTGLFADHSRAETGQPAL